MSKYIEKNIKIDFKKDPDNLWGIKLKLSLEEYVKVPVNSVNIILHSKIASTLSGYWMQNNIRFSTFNIFFNHEQIIVNSPPLAESSKTYLYLTIENKLYRPNLAEIKGYWLKH